MIDLYRKMRSLIFPKKREIKQEIIFRKGRLLETFGPRPAKEYSGIREELATCGHISDIGSLRFFYDLRDMRCVQVMIDDRTINLRGVYGFPKHRLWKITDDMISVWRKEHDLPHEDLLWISMTNFRRSK